MRAAVRHSLSVVERGPVTADFAMLDRKVRPEISPSARKWVTGQHYIHLLGACTVLNGSMHPEPRGARVPALNAQSDVVGVFAIAPSRALTRDTVAIGRHWTQSPSGPGS